MYDNHPDPDTCVVVIGTLTCAELPALCERVRSLVAANDVDVVSCDVGALVVDLVAVEALAHLQLTARRLGARIHLREVSGELEALLALCGLDEILSSDELSRRD